MEERKNKTAINRWNRREYLVVEQKDGMVMLQRDDGSRFVIEKKEYFFNYKEKAVDKIN